MICLCLTYLDMQQATAEFRDVALGLADSDPALPAPARPGPLPAGCGT